MTEVQLTEEQRAAVDAAIATLKGEGPNRLSIGGYAGTGKTTLIKSILQHFSWRPDVPIEEQNFKTVAVVAFTGKAVSVLRRKGIPQAETLHSLMYTPDMEEDEFGNKRIKKPLTFVKQPYLECEGVIVDEASMLNSTLFNDLMGYGLPVVFVGDHGQLEPIGDNPGVMLDPDIKLEKIHRQAAQSPILVFAHVVREGKRLNWASLPQPCDLKQVNRSRAQATCHEYDAVIVAKNTTRHSYNKQVRANLGRTGTLVVGEKLICLRNSKSTGIFNGNTFTVTALGEERMVSVPSGSLTVWKVDIKTEEGVDIKDAFIHMCAPDEKPQELELQFGELVEGSFVKREALACDYGYVLTAHKSQGSEWPRVMVIDELWPGVAWDAARWRYTAATRAAKELTWVG